jgi:hypothetical protein
MSSIYSFKGVTKRRRWMTNSAHVYEAKCGGMGGGEAGVTESQPMSTAVHMEPK